MSTLTMPEVGEMAPDFKLKGSGGAFYTLSEYRGSKAVVLLFFPLAFSGVCSHQLPAAEKDFAKFQAAGAEVFGISVDSHHSNTAFANALGLSFPLLSDWKREASRAYGVLLESANYSTRALFVVGRDGRILHRELSEDMDDVAKIPSTQRALAALGA